MLCNHDTFSILQFSGGSCSYKNGALLAKFQPGVLNPFVLICGCLLYDCRIAGDEIKVGDHVYLHVPVIKSEQTKKLHSWYDRRSGQPQKMARSALQSTKAVSRAPTEGPATWSAYWPAFQFTSAGTSSSPSLCSGWDWSLVCRQNCSWRERDVNTSRGRGLPQRYKCQLKNQ